MYTESITDRLKKEVGFNSFFYILSLPEPFTLFFNVYKKSSRIGVKLSINRAMGDTTRIECFIPEGI